MDIGLTLKEEISDHQGGIKEIGVHRDGGLFFARSDEMLVVYRLDTGKKVKGFYDSSGFDAATFDINTGNLIYLTEEKLHFWDPSTWRERMILTGELIEFRDTDIHSGTGLYANGNNDGSIEIRKMESDPYESPDMVLQGHKNYIEYTCFHPGGKVLASGSADMTLRFWDLGAGKEISSHKVHKDFVTALAFNREGNMMVSGDYSGIIKIWDFKIINQP